MITSNTASSRRWIPILAIALLLLPERAQAQPAPAPQALQQQLIVVDGVPIRRIGPADAVVHPDDEAAYSQLERTLPEVRMDAIAFSDVLEFFRDVTGARISVNWQAIEAAGIDRNAPVTARLRDVKFGKALATILHDTGGGAVRLSYTVENGVILISTQDELNSHAVSLAHDIRELLASVADLTPEVRKQFIDQIILLIRETIARETWADNGGKPGTIREQQGHLIVLQIPENQRHIARLLQQLHETRAAKCVIEARIIEMPRARAAALGPAATLPEGAAVDDRAIGNLQVPDVTIRSVPRLTVFTDQQALIASEQFAPWSSLGVTPTISSDRQRVTMKVIRTNHPPNARISQPVLPMQWEATFTLPDGGTYVCKVMEAEPDRDIWLAIKATIITPGPARNATEPPAPQALP